LIFYVAGVWTLPSRHPVGITGAISMVAVDFTFQSRN
jgi:hypothetical protein